MTKKTHETSTEDPDSTEHEESIAKPRDRVLMALLASCFPSLNGKPGVDPWEPHRLDRWACGPEPRLGARCAARFVLSVWNPVHEWRCGKFDLEMSLVAWNAEHRAVFAEWVLDPWWP